MNTLCKCVCQLGSVYLPSMIWDHMQDQVSNLSGYQSTYLHSMCTIHNSKAKSRLHCSPLSRLATLYQLSNDLPKSDPSRRFILESLRMPESIGSEMMSLLYSTAALSSLAKVGSQYWRFSVSRSSSRVIRSWVKTRRVWCPAKCTSSVDLFTWAALWTWKCSQSGLLTRILRSQTFHVLLDTW